MLENDSETKTCRTCLLVQPNTVHILNFVTYSSPRRTLADILKNLAKLKFLDEQECNMPQNMCSICCRQLRSMYMFVKQVQECNDKLLTTLHKTSDNQQRQTILFSEEKEAAIKIKKESSNEQELVQCDRFNNWNSDLKTNFMEVTFETPYCANNMDRRYFECEDIHNNEVSPNTCDILQLTSDDSENQEMDVSSSNPNILDVPVKSLTLVVDKSQDDDSDEDTAYLDTIASDKVPTSTDMLRNVSCAKCNKNLSSHEKLLEHMRIEHTENTNTKRRFFTCVYCSQKYDDKRNLNIHLINKHKTDYNDSIKNDKSAKENNKMKCKLCEYSARTPAALHFHKRSKHGTEDDKIKCNFCSYSSYKKFDLLHHIKKSHLSAIKTLKRNLKKGESAGETQSLKIKPNSQTDIKESLHKLQEYIDKKDEDPIENSAEDYNEECSSGDENLIRDILNIKKRSTRSTLIGAPSSTCKTKETTIFDDVKPHSPEIQHVGKRKENTSCPLCEKVLNGRDDLLTHMLLEHREQCSSAYVDNSKCSTSRNDMLKCEHCSTKFTHKYEKRNHLRDQHDIFFKASKTKPEYTIENKVIMCRLCDYTTKTYAGLHYHTRSKHGTENDKFKCNFCSYTCFKKFDLLHHTKRTHLSAVKAIKKDIEKNKREGETSATEMVPNKFPGEDITSLVQKHQGAGNLDATENCLEVSSGDDDIIRDILNMKKRVPKSGTSSSFARRCEECGNVYRNSVALNVHRRMVHREHVYSQCTHCERKYKRPYDLKLHILDKHTPKDVNLKPTPKVEREKRFMCTQCSYICSTSTLLTIHTHRHHTGEKPYKCEFCSKAFVVPSDLKTHRYLHTGERPFQCSICLKGFRDKNHMQRHKRTHCEVKPYNCLECGKGFSKNYNLSIHKRTHMKGQKLRCLVCGKYFKDRALLNVHQISENHHEEVV